MINSTTQFIGLIGNPIAHSMSPPMQNEAIKQLGLNYRYLAFQVEHQSLKQAVEGMKALNFRGFNVTIPFKVEIMPFLDEISEEAKVVGAVNTVVNQDGKLVGYNTDGEGYLRSLIEETNVSLRDKTVAILGAGGAARAIGYTIAKEPIKELYIVNRDMDKGKKLADKLSYYAKCQIDETKHLSDTLAKSDIIINTTSIGMEPQIEKSMIDIGWLKSAHIVSDIIYNPLETKLIKDAKQKGAITHTGLGMFINQGAIAFEKWFGIYPDSIAMRKEVLTHLM